MFGTILSKSLSHFIVLAPFISSSVVCSCDLLPDDCQKHGIPQGATTSRFGGQKDPKRSGDSSLPSSASGLAARLRRARCALPALPSPPRPPASHRGFAAAPREVTHPLYCCHVTTLRPLLRETSVGCWLQRARHLCTWLHAPTAAEEASGATPTGAMRVPAQRMAWGMFEASDADRGAKLRTQLEARHSHPVHAGRGRLSI